MIDYNYNAKQRIALAIKERDTQEASVIAQIALAEATLALVEQQRIANLIALAGLEMNGPLRHLVIDLSSSPHTVDVKDELKEALGCD